MQHHRENNLISLLFLLKFCLTTNTFKKEFLLKRQNESSNENLEKLKKKRILPTNQDDHNNKQQKTTLELDSKGYMVGNMKEEQVYKILDRIFKIFCNIQMIKDSLKEEKSKDEDLTKFIRNIVKQKIKGNQRTEAIRKFNEDYFKLENLSEDLIGENFIEIGYKFIYFLDSRYKYFNNKKDILKYKYFLSEFFTLTYKYKNSKNFYTNVIYSGKNDLIDFYIENKEIKFKPSKFFLDTTSESNKTVFEISNFPDLLFIDTKYSFKYFYETFTKDKKYFYNFSFRSNSYFISCII